MVTGIVPHVGGPILPPGEPTVLIGMLPAARMTDMATCVGPPDSIMMGSPTVLIGNLMAARIGDPTDHGGVIVLGEPTVEIGEVGMGTPTVVTPAPPLVILAQAMSGSGSAAAQAVSNAAQDLAQAAQAGAATVAFKLASQPLVQAAGGTAQQDAGAAAPGGVPQPEVDDPKLQNLVKDLYKGAKTANPIGSGSTADAIRHEMATGEKVGGRFHAQKGREYARALEKWLEKNPSASPKDRAAAQSVLDDTRSALEGK